jgi:hypothetical protein
LSAISHGLFSKPRLAPFPLLFFLAIACHS